MKGHLRMSGKELHRKSVMEQVHRKQLTLCEASLVLELSYRQARRVYARFCAEGDSGLVHRSRGKPSKRGKPESFRRQALSLYQERYAALEMGPTLAAEKLFEAGLDVDHETLRRWLIADGQWQRRRKRGPHRRWRERKGRFGELVQLDGSHHAWFGPEQEKACLMNMVDDATGTTYSLLFEEETTEAAMRLLWGWIERYGIPEALYADRKNVYITEREPTLEEQLSGEEPMTVFGKACKKLGIRIIAAYSPQAKGRVERNHGVYQDRFLKELALRGIKTIPEANRLLGNGFTEGLNCRFAVEPADSRDAHRPLPKGMDLAQIFCFEETRQVQNDWTIRYQNQRYQINPKNKPLPRPKSKVLVRTLLDGTLLLLYRDIPLDFERLPLQAPRPAPERKKEVTPPRNRPKVKKPDQRHPWRQGCAMMLNDPTPKGTRK